MDKLSQGRKMDMLSGPLAGKLIAFALPLAASSILQQLFNAVDVAVVGHFAANQAQATAAVGCNGPVINLIVNLFVGLSVGANVVVSAFIGHQEKDNARRAVHSAMTIALISGILLLFIGLVVSRPLLELIGTPEDVLGDAVVYHVVGNFHSEGHLGAVEKLHGLRPDLKIAVINTVHYDPAAESAADAASAHADGGEYLALETAHGA